MEEGSKAEERLVPAPADPEALTCSTELPVLQITGNCRASHCNISLAGCLGRPPVQSQHLRPGPGVPRHHGGVQGAPREDPPDGRLLLCLLRGAGQTEPQ